MKLVFELTDKITVDVLKDIISQFNYKLNRVDDFVDISYPEGQVHINDPLDRLPGSDLTLCLRRLEERGQLVCKLATVEPAATGNNLLGLLLQDKTFRLPYWRSNDTLFQYGEPVEGADYLALEWWKRALSDRRIFYFDNPSNLVIAVDISNGMATNDVYQSLYRWLRTNYEVKIRGQVARILVWSNWPESISQYYGEQLKVLTNDVLLFTEESFICKLLDDGHAKMNDKLVAVYKRIDRTEEQERDSTF